MGGECPLHLFPGRLFDPILGKEKISFKKILSPEVMREFRVRGLRRQPIPSSRFGTAVFFEMTSNLMGLNTIQNH